MAGVEINLHFQRKTFMNNKIEQLTAEGRFSFLQFQELTLNDGTLEHLTLEFEYTVNGIICTELLDFGAYYCPLIRDNIYSLAGGQIPVFPQMDRSHKQVKIKAISKSLAEFGFSILALKY